MGILALICYVTVLCCINENLSAYQKWFRVVFKVAWFDHFSLSHADHCNCFPSPFSFLSFSQMPTWLPQSGGHLGEFGLAIITIATNISLDSPTGHRMNICVLLRVEHPCQYLWMDRPFESWYGQKLKWRSIEVWEVLIIMVYKHIISIIMELDNQQHSFLEQNKMLYIVILSTNPLLTFTSWWEEWMWAYCSFIKLFSWLIVSMIATYLV